jgi:tetratricopeptide (TPR) repeat protein
MTKPQTLAIGIVLALAGAVTWACGPWFPTQMLDDRDATLKAVPQNTFAFEAAHLLPATDTLAAVEAPRYGEPAAKPDLPADEAERIKALADTETGAAAFDAGKDLPDDVRHYVAGAVDWKRATADCPGAPESEYGETLSKPPCDRFDADALASAQSHFEAVTALPPEQANARGAWAAYMLGEVHALRAAKAAGTPAFAAERGTATKAFQDTRARVLAGASDAQGLAVASFGEEARQHLYAGAKACLWVDMVKGDDCVAALAPADLKHAIALYAAQAGHGSPNAVESLAAIAAAVLGEPGQAAALVDGPVSQRLLVAYALGRVSPQSADGKPDPTLSALFDAIVKAGPDKVAAADRLASLTYELGRYDEAEKLLAHAEGPLASWVRAKLALRKGDRNAAALAYADAAKAFPRVDDPKAALEPASVHQLIGERGVLALARGDYVEAMTRMYEAAKAVGGDGTDAGDDEESAGVGYGGDLMYIGERVLTIDELKTFVDANAPTASPTPSADDKNASYATPTLTDRLRWMLARRLMRAGRFDDAFAYFPSGIDKRYAEVDLRATAHAYAEAVKDGDHRWTDIGKAEARYAAAKIAREHGMELMGYEQAPDYADNGGGYQGGSGQSAETLKGDLVTAGERQRFGDSSAQPDRRFHYRYVAADRAVSAADLLPPRSQAFAATLCVAASWMLEGPGDDNEAGDGEEGKPLNERQRRVQAYYARYVKEGPYVDWAWYFGQTCEQPNFERARELKRAQQVRAVKHFIRKNLIAEVVVLVLIVGGLGWLVARRRRRKPTA